MRFAPSMYAFMVLYVYYCVAVLILTTSARSLDQGKEAHLELRETSARSRSTVPLQQDLITRGCLSDCLASVKHLVMGHPQRARYSSLARSPSSEGKRRAKRSKETPRLPPSSQMMTMSGSASTSTASSSRKPSTSTSTIFQKAQEDRQALVEGTSARDRKGTIRALGVFGRKKH